MQNSLDPFTIVFAIIAIFVVWKLKAVLGTRTDIEKRPPPAIPEKMASGEMGKVVRLPGAAERVAANAQRDPNRFDSFASTQKARKGLLEISQADPNFDAARFIEGAKVAYEMIINAFANGDRKALENLLSQDVFSSFSSVIIQRETTGAQAVTKLVSLESVEIVDAVLKEDTAQISLRILAKIINSVSDGAGAVLSGDPLAVVSSDDLWTFARAVASSDPTWRLVATESDH